MNMTVTDATGAYIHSLSQRDFIVVEDGKPQSISFFSVEETPFAAAILMDSSGSMEGRITLARAAAIRFLNSLREDDVAAVYRFDSKIVQLQDFSASHDLVPSAYGVTARGNTLLNDAVQRAAIDLAKRPEKRRAIIVLSDGADNGSRLSLDKALAASLTANVTLYTVDMSQPGPGSSPSAAPALRTYATKSGGRFISTPGGRALSEAFTNIVEELTNQYTVGYKPTNANLDGRWRAIQVQTVKPDIQVRTRKGYYGRRK